MLTPINTILYASDLDCDSKAALYMAMSLANQYQARLVFLHVIEPVNNAAYNWGAADMWLEIKTETYKRAVEVSTEIIDELFAELDATGTAIAKPDVNIIHGHSAENILRYATEVHADMIVMGSRGHSALGQFFLGSVADKVARMSHCPVTLVPA